MNVHVDKLPAAIREVIPFVFQHCLKQPVRLAIVLVGFLGASIADLLMPGLLKLPR